MSGVKVFSPRSKFSILKFTFRMHLSSKNMCFQYLEDIVTAAPVTWFIQVLENGKKSCNLKMFFQGLEKFWNSFNFSKSPGLYRFLF